MGMQELSDEEIIFINDIIERTCKKDKELKNFIDKHLFPKHSKLAVTNT
ncbi:MAG TPA: hypothetical protein GXX18_15890 [Bacillales bacterium]|nr:hypothetical protein [Bacillales bacterium]